MSEPIRVLTLPEAEQLRAEFKTGPYRTDRLLILKAHEGRFWFAAGFPKLTGGATSWLGVGEESFYRRLKRETVWSDARIPTGTKVPPGALDLLHKVEPESRAATWAKAASFASAAGRSVVVGDVLKAIGAAMATAS